MKATKKVLSFILALAMLLSVAMFPAAAEDAVVTLSDIDKTSTVGQAVTRLVSLGIINGYEDGTFRPNNNITRAEFCVIMVKFENMQDYINPTALTGFEDLDTDANYEWVRPYVAMAVQRGIINGFEDGTFRAADPVTYEQAIKMIVCCLGYGDSAKKPTILGDWSSGYVAKAMQLGVTKGTTSDIVNKTQPSTRGTVAILVNNALDATRADMVTDDGSVVMPGDDAFSGLGYEEITGVVTGTYLTELEMAKSTVPKNHIQIDDEIYEIGFSRDPNEYLGCKVDAIISEESEFGDYPVVTSLELHAKNDVIEVEAGLVGDYEDGVLYYMEDKDDKDWEKVKVEDDYITIFNNKYWEYDIADLQDELVTGNVVLVDNDGDKKVEVVRINSYDVFVVASKSTSTQKITLMYDAQYNGEPTLMFPEDSTSLVFSLTRNGKEIAFKDIAKWDVLNIKASPEEAEGRRYYEVVVTRETVSGTVTERDDGDATYIVIDDKEYKIADSFVKYEAEDKPELNVGDSAQVYLDAEGNIVAAAESVSGDSSENYAYLFSLRQDSDESDYDLEFWLYTMSGKELMIGSAAKITIDGVKYKALDKSIPKILNNSAQIANGNYEDATGFVYHQPIIYQTNSEGLVSTIYTVNSEHEDISMILEDGEEHFCSYDERQYKSQSKSFTDFKVSSSTKILYVPDDRSETDEYLIFSSYSKAFVNTRYYHVEAFGLTKSGTASLVLIYKENDSKIYTSSSPWMIVASKSETKAGTVIEGYTGTSYSLRTVTVSEEDGPSNVSVGKGDVIRYLVNGDGELVDYQVWFDASEPVQLESCSDMETAIDNRILEIHSTKPEPVQDTPSAAFRLQFGTVTEITLDDGDSVDEESITVAPTIVEDDMDMAYDGRGVTSRNIGSSVKVFYYDATTRSSEVVKEAELSEVLDYVNYGEDATRVITYSASGTLRMVYIVVVE